MIGRRTRMEKKLSKEGLELIDKLAQMTVDVAKLQAEIEVEQEKKQEK